MFSFFLDALLLLLCLLLLVASVFLHLITCLVFCFDLCSVLFPLLVITETITKPEILMVVFDLMLFSCFQ